MNIVDYLDRRYINNFIFNILVFEDLRASIYTYRLSIAYGSYYDDFKKDTTFHKLIDSDEVIANYLKIPLNYYKEILEGCGGIYHNLCQGYRFLNKKEAEKAAEQLYCTWILLRLVGET